MEWFITFKIRLFSQRNYLLSFKLGKIHFTYFLKKDRLFSLEKVNYLTIHTNKPLNKYSKNIACLHFHNLNETN